MSKPDPKLSDVLPPKFASCTKGDVDDAMLWWGRLSGNIEANWAQPERDVIVEKFAYGELRTMAHGLKTVARLAQIINGSGTDSVAADWLSSGLDAAICGLADALDSELERHGERYGG